MIRLAGRGQADAQHAVPLPGGSGDVRGDDIGGMAVQRGAGPVVAHGGARVGMRGGFLHITQRHPGI
jgi:hypothetical protein